MFYHNSILHYFEQHIQIFILCVIRPAYYSCCLIEKADRERKGNWPYYTCLFNLHMQKTMAMVFCHYICRHCYLRPAALSYISPIPIIPIWKKNLESSNKRLGIIFWTVNFSIFSQNIYKNYLISQSNIPLTLIQSIDHTTQTNICLDMIFQETILDVFDGILH